MVAPTNSSDILTRRKKRTKNKLAEPLRAVPGIDRNGKDVWFIRGWITNDLPCKRQCPRGTEEMRNEAARIIEEEELRRVQLSGGDAKGYAAQFTWLDKDQIHEAETAFSHLKAAKRNGLVKHVDYALSRMVDRENSRPLEVAIDSFRAVRKRRCDRGELRDCSYIEQETVLKSLRAFYPGITLHEFAFEKTAPPCLSAPKVHQRGYAELLGVSINEIASMTAAGAPLPAVVYTHGHATWDLAEVAALRNWLHEHGSRAKLPDQLPPPPVAAQSDMGSDERSRLAIFCELPARRGKGRMLAGGQVSRTTLQHRRKVLLCFLQYCLDQEWIEKLPNFPQYEKHKDRVRGRAPCLSLEESETYLRWVEKDHRSHVCREVLKLFGHLRPDLEMNRFEAWINPATLTALPQAADWPYKPNVADLAFWPEVRMMEIEDGCMIAAAGVLQVDPTVSKKRLPRTIYLSPNAALWLAVYQPEWHMGSWKPDVAKVHFQTFDQYVDKFYVAQALSWYDRKQVKKLGVTLKHNILRHSNISYCVARYPSILSAAKLSGNSPSIIETCYLNVCSKEAAKQFFAILPFRWRWGADGKSFVPPAGWKRPAGWVLPLATVAAP